MVKGSYWGDKLRVEDFRLVSEGKESEGGSIRRKVVRFRRLIVRSILSKECLIKNIRLKLFY